MRFSHLGWFRNYCAVNADIPAPTAPQTLRTQNLDQARDAPPPAGDRGAGRRWQLLHPSVTVARPCPAPSRVGAKSSRLHRKGKRLSSLTKTARHQPVTPKHTGQPPLVGEWASAAPAKAQPRPAGGTCSPAPHPPNPAPPHGQTPAAAPPRNSPSHPPDSTPGCSLKSSPTGPLGPSPHLGENGPVRESIWRVARLGLGSTRKGKGRKGVGTLGRRSRGPRPAALAARGGPYTDFPT